MNTTPATDSLVTARLLSTSRYTAVFNALLLALSAQQGGAWAVVQLILTAALLYCHIRIEFDRRVFQDLAEGRYTPEAFDQTLRQTSLRRVADSRDMPQRVSGALALWRKSLYLTAAQSSIFLTQLL
ncbi:MULTISPECIES: hypothetical protein [unclassified Eikenella]|uniref:hypothetical protein n=1 Tax=unclassified Eikenella TaxID=2639367 RepID=UPI0007DECD6A|nr:MULTISPECIES: hypothetical protein [unclassified Eikenella]OAM27200.1 hypothetical protein A7P94_06450 [Eikenella sp. NML01-A-086]OAM43263.1 hypothetical protein A7Q02_00830 [Eikenella sp. NML97-A-109]